MQRAAAPAVVRHHLHQRAHTEAREINGRSVGGRHLAQLLRHLDHLQRCVTADAAVACVRRSQVFAERESAGVDEEVVVVGVNANDAG